MHIHLHNFCLCTAKELIHPQYPQGYPQLHRRKVAEYRGFHRRYPHYPQVFHRRYPRYTSMWICMWTSHFARFFLFTHVTLMHIYTLMHIFCVKHLPIPAISPPKSTFPKIFVLNENATSPKKTHQSTVYKKEPRKGLPAHSFNGEIRPFHPVEHVDIIRLGHPQLFIKAGGVLVGAGVHDDVFLAPASEALAGDAV